MQWLPLTYAAAAVAVYAVPVAYFGYRHGLPPAPNPAVVRWVAGITAASFGYAWAMRRRCPPQWRTTVALSRAVSFWYAVSSPFLVFLAWVFGPVVAVWLPANVWGTALLARGRAGGLALKLFCLLPPAVAGFIPLTTATDRPGKVIGDAYPTMAGWAVLDLGVLLAAVFLAARGGGAPDVPVPTQDNSGALSPS
jgi:hypothetical protein